MAKTVSIGKQDFADLRQNDYFYIDKTGFIKEWWEAGDDVTLVTRPRRFGKTLTVSMLECFFSERYADCGYLFEGLDIWKEECYRQIQGTYPVISLSFANVKKQNYEECYHKICGVLEETWDQYKQLLHSKRLDEDQKQQFLEYKQLLHERKADGRVEECLNFLSRLLYTHTGKKVLIFLDEYDTPLQEAYVGGFWDELVSFVRSLFHATFKSNASMLRAVLTGITRISRQSVFSGLNHLEVVTTTSREYAAWFGFTEAEVFAAMEEFGLSGTKEDVKRWYDGFTFGDITDVYNPWSIVNYLKKKKFMAYWVNTSSNDLIAHQLQQADENVKQLFGQLLNGKTIQVGVDEEIAFNQLEENPDAIWSLLLASGYLKVVYVEPAENEEDSDLYTLSLTNLEVRRMFRKMVRNWFKKSGTAYNDFIRAMLSNNVMYMNRYMNKVALNTFSYFDTGMRPSGAEPERFYHGFVLGLMVELSGQYEILSNRESGFGRYDVVLAPKKEGLDAFVLEFKVRNAYDGEKTLEDTAAAALQQIEEKLYVSALVEKGIPLGRIYTYGFAFEGKTVLIAGGKG